ncbi:hypothetical protein TI39_contig693g00001 [Zymoseptoria brevis]|uniref:Uncharacterized protein n=1 Tax=Zymoseptoria brevis TaxID=1047168 RepID=A0A0F4GJ64_9PEZI|nr:hypothetical protein TI39_contig693g00001 [Zymoseptoria brevis]
MALHFASMHIQQLNLLDEGNFDAAMATIDCLLLAKGFGKYTSDQLDVSPERFDFDIYTDVVIEIVRSRVSPHILTRLPLNYDDSGGYPTYPQFFKKLKGLAQPFRLMHLPAEIRDLIYQEHFTDLPTQTILPQSERSSIPPIMQTSSVLRSEGFAWYYTCCHFKAIDVLLPGSRQDFGSDNFNMQNPRRKHYDPKYMQGQLFYWLDVVGKENHKYLTHLTFGFCREGDDARVPPRAYVLRINGRSELDVSTASSADGGGKWRPDPRLREMIMKHARESGNGGEMIVTASSGLPFA